MSASYRELSNLRRKIVARFRRLPWVRRTKGGVGDRDIVTACRALRRRGLLQHILARRGRRISKIAHSRQTMLIGLLFRSPDVVFSPPRLPIRIEVEFLSVTRIDWTSVAQELGMHMHRTCPPLLETGAAALARTNHRSRSNSVTFLYVLLFEMHRLLLPTIAIGGRELDDNHATEPRIPISLDHSTFNRTGVLDPSTAVALINSVVGTNAPGIYVCAHVSGRSVIAIGLRSDCGNGISQGPTSAQRLPSGCFRKWRLLEIKIADARSTLRPISFSPSGIRLGITLRKGSFSSSNLLVFLP